MNIEIVEHARERMGEYDVSEELVMSALKNPDHVLSGHSGRNIYQKKLNGYVLRVIVEESQDTRTVITVYKARSGRYGV